MKYFPNNTFQFQLLIQLVGVILFITTDIGPFSQAILSGIALCLVGIPHGANDYLYRADQSKIGLLKFLLSYVGTIVLYLLAWWIVPHVALAVFFLISLHHFGQSNFENQEIWHLPSLLWGIWILLLPILLHVDEAISIFKSMVFMISYEGNFGSSALDLKWWQVAVLGIVGVAYVVSLFVYNKKQAYSYLMQFTLVTIWYTVTPLLFGFIMVFSLWHSIQSLEHQAQHFKSNDASSMGDFFYALVPFSALALLFFGLYVAFFGFNISLSFVLLSLISLPHVIVMHKLYKGREHAYG